MKDKIENIINASNYKTKKITKKPTEAEGNTLTGNGGLKNKRVTVEIDDLLVEISTLDHPGLLSKICEAFDSFDLMVKDAKISTLGEEANDIFVLFPFNEGKKVTSQNIIELKNKIKLKISELYV